MILLPPNPALFIDIDNTIVRCRNDGDPPMTMLDQSLLWLMQQAAVERGMAAEEAERIIRHIYSSIRWWHWTDFLRALDLDPSAFWEDAYQQESRCLEPFSERMAPVIKRLHQHGFRMFITSNNPCSGILHKLRLAGLGQIWGSPYFLRYLSPPDLHCMKEEPEFWRRCMAHTGLNGREVVTIGDNWHADVLVPQQAGIAHSIHLDPSAGKLQRVCNGTWKASSWSEIGRMLLATSFEDPEKGVSDEVPAPGSLVGYSLEGQP